MTSTQSPFQIPTPYGISPQRLGDRREMTVNFAFRLSRIPQRGRRRKTKSIHLQWGVYSNTMLSNYQRLGLHSRSFSCWSGFHRRPLSVDEKGILLSVLCVSSESRDSGMKRAVDICSLSYSHFREGTLREAHYTLARLRIINCHSN